jgi:hypothetical protein
VTTDAIPAEFIESLSQRRRNGKPNLLIIGRNTNQARKDKKYRYLNNRNNSREAVGILLWPELCSFKA